MTLNHELSASGITGIECNAIAPNGLKAVSGGECYEEERVRMGDVEAGEVLIFSGAGEIFFDSSGITPTFHSPFEQDELHLFSTR